MDYRQNWMDPKLPLLKISLGKAQHTLNHFYSKLTPGPISTLSLGWWASSLDSSSPEENNKLMEEITMEELKKILHRLSEGQNPGTQMGSQLSSTKDALRSLEMTF
jgi:hypothetical protein